ncbi:MAG: DNA repair protein RadA [Clostridia bacterium]|nr:DNA repair protein RadA [Clostridia bacterium]
MKKKTAYVCTNCGYDSPKWTGQCPNCKEWNTMEEFTVKDEPKNSRVSSGGRLPSAVKKAVYIDEIDINDEVRVLTEISELDRVLGGGFVNGSLTLISGEPGIGKSTLLLQACENLGKEHNVLYVSGEESLPQIKLRAQRTNVSSKKIKILSETNLEDILIAMENEKPRFVIIDSVQTIFDPKIASTPGSITQVRECTMTLMQVAKQHEVSIILVGHVNKDGNIAGPKILEHMVDTVLYFEGEKHITYRMLRAAKNRFGSTNEIGLFEMTSSGLVDVKNPSAALLSGRPENVSGSCVVATLEGTRPVLTEIQGLVTKSSFGSARRTAAGIDYNRFVLILAILEKRLGMMLSSYDAYINVVGGIRIDEPAVDLGIAVAIASSYLDKPVSPDVVLLGEIGLSGELRAVQGSNQRIQEIKRLGYKKCILPLGCKDENMKIGGIELVYVRDVGEAIKASF